MSNIDFIKVILEILQLNDSYHRFIPFPFNGSDTCLKTANDVMYINLKSTIGDIGCPHCGSIDRHHSKGTRSIELTHFSFGAKKVILIVNYHRFYCNHCHRYFVEDIPFRFDNRMMTTPNAQCALHEFSENHSMASISRMHGLKPNTMYRIFNENIEFKPRYYRLSSVISIDEFKATSDLGEYAFHIVNPLTGKTLDIMEDRKADALIKYFSKIPYKEKKKVKIIIMDLSGAFQSTMRRLFPNAIIIADKFHYVKLVRLNMVQSRLDTCTSIKYKPLAKSIKRNLHLFDKYHKNLKDKKEWYDPHLKKYFTCKSYVEYIFDQEETSEFLTNYNIYQSFLKILHEPNQDYKQELNKWLDNIFDTDNQYYLTTAKNFRKNWFMPILNSLTYTATYIRNGISHKTSYNNGFIESMNNVVKLVKRNAHGYRYFHNLRKRIFLHLGHTYTFKFSERKKGIAIF